MINKINSTNTIRFITKPSFKSTKEENDTLKTPQMEINSAETLANYSVAAMKINKKYDIKPLVPTIYDRNNTDSIIGERIYDSDGKLYSIVEETPFVKVTYIPAEDDNKMFSSITTVDKTTDNVIRKQVNRIEDGQYKSIDIMEYSPIDGELTSYSYYVNGKPYTVGKVIKNKKGLKQDISYNYQDNEYYIYESSKDGNHSNIIRMTKDLKFVNINELKKVKNTEITKEASFYNGGLISFEEHKYTVVPNLLGREPLVDKDLKPAKKYNIESITTDIEGNKTYYSNGAVETISVPDGRAFFSPDGKLEKAISDSIKLEFDSVGNQFITENIDDDVVKETTYFNDGSVKVCYRDQNSYKEINLNKDSKIHSYHEGVADGIECSNSNKSFYYTDSGILKNAYNF